MTDRASGSHPASRPPDTGRDGPPRARSDSSPRASRSGIESLSGPRPAVGHGLEFDTHSGSDSLTGSTLIEVRGHDMIPGLPERGTPVRLASEFDVMAVVTAVFVVATLLTVATTAATWDGHTAGGPWPLFALVVPHLLILAAVLAATYYALPSTRWLAPDDLARRPRMLGLRIARILGAPAVLIRPALEARDRREHGRRPLRTEVERAMLTLLTLPRAVGVFLGAALITLAISDTLIAAQQLLWSWPLALTHLALWFTLAGPLVVLAVAGVHLAVRPDVLAAPQAILPLPNAPPVSRTLYGIAALGLGAAALAPLLLVHLWVQAEARKHGEQTADRHARALVAAAAPGREVELGRLLAEIPGASVITAKGASYGLHRSFPPEISGPVDTDLDGDIDVIGVAENGAAAAVALPRPSAPPVRFFLVSAGLCLLAGAAGVFFLARAHDRDLQRVRARIAAAESSLPAPPPIAPDWLALSRAVDGLVVRMQEATIARFVALEKAEETDRLRSQFLANMSHDLRSPLNSILGFSSLLLRGVDGNLDGEQREMIETIASAGKDLLQQIDAILDMARIEARRIELQAEPVPLAPLISRAVQKSRARSGGDLNYSIETVPGLPTAFVDPRHLVQALENLLLFAGKRVPPGGVVAIKLRAGDIDSPLGLQIHITTPAKPATLQQLDLARRGFHRLPGHRGLGLELPIADALLRIEGCRLDVKEVGGAMLFKIHLPAAEARQRVVVQERALGQSDSLPG